MFDLKNNLIEKIKKMPREFNFEAHGRKFLVRICFFGVEITVLKLLVCEKFMLYIFRG